LGIVNETRVLDSSPKTLVFYMPFQIKRPEEVKAEKALIYLQPSSGYRHEL
jgi:hypothetical protein